jgi:hypothetical protein
MKNKTSKQKKTKTKQKLWHVFGVVWSCFVYNKTTLKGTEALGVWGITDIYLNDNSEPTTPFLSDQKNQLDFES